MTTRTTTVSHFTKGHTFTAALRGSRVAIRRDGRELTELGWNEDGFVATGHDLGFADIDDAADVYDALRRALLSAQRPS